MGLVTPKNGHRNIAILHKATAMQPAVSTAEPIAHAGWLFHSIGLLAMAR
jgi:hypothetical protein